MGRPAEQGGTFGVWARPRGCGMIVVVVTQTLAGVIAPRLIPYNTVFIYFIVYYSGVCDVKPYKIEYS